MLQRLHEGSRVTQSSIISSLRELFANVSPKRRKQLVPMLLLMLVGAVAEVGTIGALLPFLAVIADPKGSPVLGYIRPFLDIFGMGGPDRVVYALTALFAVAAMVSAVLRLALLWASSSFVNGIGCELVARLYEDALHRPYVYHTQRNSSEIIAAINKVEILSNGMLAPLMQGVTALVISGGMIAGLIAIDPVVAVAAGLGFAGIYLVATRITRSRLRRNGLVIAEAQGRRVKAMQEGLGGIRDVLIDRSQPVFVETYARAEARLRDAKTRNTVFANAPRYLVEAVGMIMIAAVAVMVTGRPGGVAEAIPVLGALALGAQRLLPLIQQMYAGWAQTIGYRQVLFDVLDLLDVAAPQRVNSGEPLAFARSVQLVDVGYSYARGRGSALTGITLDIPKGARVGIAGKTGSGKSTLMDLLLGLLDPTEGEIRVDGVALTPRNRAAWQKNIAHVPQAIYLADATITQNIAFGVRPEAIDMARVRRAAEQAELAEVIAALPEGYDTHVGERGIQLSGGQRQRIGIARALYKQASVLVFDEATSALDNETETAVMEAIERLDRDLTILLIAHRLSTLEGCDMIVRLEGGRVKTVEQRHETTVDTPTPKRALP